jgi:hypothetical protein
VQLIGSLKILFAEIKKNVKKNRQKLSEFHMVDNQDPRASAINFFSPVKRVAQMWITLKLRNAYE